MITQPILKNISKIYFYNFAIMFLIMIPIIVPYWQSFGLNIQQIYELQAIFGLTIVILDVPAGYFSDLIGRKTCLLIVGILNFVRYLFLYFGHHFSHFVLFQIISALSFALFSGCDIALIYDSLDEAKIPHDHQSNYLGKRIFYSQLGETIGAVFGGILAVYSLRLPVLLNMITSIFPFIIAITIIEPKRHKMDHKNHLKNIQLILKALFFHSSYLTTLIIFNIIYGFSSFLAIWAYQPYWKETNIPLSMYGYLWALFNLAVALFARYNKWFNQYFSFQQIILMIIICPIIAYLGLGTNYYYWGSIFMIFFAFSRALNSVTIQYYINSKIPSHMRATANSFCSLGMRGIFFIFGPLFGKLIDQKGVHYSFNIAGISFLILMLPFIYYLLIFKRNRT